MLVLSSYCTVWLTLVGTVRFLNSTPWISIRITVE
jgi:hypothetical protein